MRKIILAIAFGVLLLPDHGFTLGLGEIEVTTALNQELNAEIELLSAAPEDVETLIVKLASREEFIRAGIERPYLLNSLRFSAELRNGQPIIKVVSDKPIREPFLNFLVEIDWPKGHMMREYTILLDPPVFMDQPAPAQQDLMRPAAMESTPVSRGAVPEPQSSTGFRPAMMAPSPAATAPAEQPLPGESMPATAQAMPVQTAPAYQRSYQPPDGYRIQKGDTLWSLADAMRPDQSVSIEQMMLAMLRSNPEVFINGNVNGLKKGYILRIPDRDDIVTMNHADAVAVVREQNALWREYQQSMAGGIPASAMEAETESDGGAGMAVDGSGGARLEIVAAGSGISASGSAKDPTQMSASELRAELAIARESLETERLEKEGLQQRIVSLEGQVDRMKSLLTLEDTDMAEMQQAVTPVEAEPMLEVTEDVVIEEQQELAVDETGMEGVAELEAMTEEDITAADELVEEATEALADDEGRQEAAFADEEERAVDEQLEAVEELIEQPVETTEDFAVTPYTEPAFMQPKKDDLLSMLMNNPVLLAAAGGGLLLLLLLVALIMKRRKSGGEEAMVASNLDDIENTFDDSDIIRVVDDEAETRPAAPEETVPEVDEPVPEPAAAEHSHKDTIVSATEEGADAEPRDDIIAEADVYLAYGIYQQAEELLQNALKDNPDKDSYRVKLAETYLASKNTDAFAEMATEMNQRRKGEDTPAWQKVVEIGQQLVPGHALFAGGAALMDDTPSSDTLAETTDEVDAAAPELDLSFDAESSAAEAGSGSEDVGTETAEPFGAVEFDLAETGADAEAEAEAEGEGGVEFDLSETQAFESDKDTQEFALDIEASELGIDEESDSAETAGDEFDLDLSAEVETLSADDDADDNEISLDEIADEVLDIDESDTAEAGAETLDDFADAAAELDALADDTTEEAATILDFSEASASASADDSLDDELDLSDLDDIDEVSTKLDLAKAYLDMGDADGTRSILDEVMTEGNDQQKKEADELLRQLG